MLYREIIAVCSEIHTKHINTLCEQNVEFVNIKPGGTYSDHWVLKGQFNCCTVFSGLLVEVMRCLKMMARQQRRVGLQHTMILEVIMLNVDGGLWQTDAVYLSAGVISISRSIRRHMAIDLNICINFVERRRSQGVTKHFESWWPHIGTEPFKKSFEMEEMKNILKGTVKERGK
jgi:hypothetical protein